MSGDRYFSGFSASASGDRGRAARTTKHAPTARDRPTDARHKPRHEPASSNRPREPTFRDLFGEHRGRGRGRGRGRPRWRGRPSQNTRHYRNGPSAGYGGDRHDPSSGPCASPYDGSDANRNPFLHRPDESDPSPFRRGGQHYYPRDDVPSQIPPPSGEPPPMSNSGLFFATARVPRPAPIDANDVNLTSRKRRKYVPGGRIGKYVKTQEFQTRSLYCDVCERDFYDENAKALHDRSKEHSDNQMRQRNAEDEAMTDDPERNGSVNKSHAPAFSQEEIAAFVKQHAAKWTRSFKAWANRSIEEAKKAADAANDRNIVTSVQREILFEFKHHTDNCTMMQESWGRKPAATGVHYRQAQPTACTDRVFTDEEKRKMDEKRRQALLSQPVDTRATEEERSALGASVPNEETQGHFVRGQTMQITQPELEPASAGLLPAENIHEVGRSEGASEEPQNPAALEEEEYIPVSITWKMSRAATYLLSSCKSVHSEIVGMRQRLVFPLVKENTEASNRNDNATDLVDRYKDLRSKFEAQEYEYETWRQDLKEVVQGFASRGTRIGSMKQCIHMQIDASIQSEDWNACRASCDELMRFHEDHGSWEAGDEEYVAYWIIAGLLKTNNDSRQRQYSRAGFSKAFSMVTRLRGLPSHVEVDILVDHALQVLKSVVSNNYWKFCQLKTDPIVNLRTKGKLGYIMDELADVVRERAIVTMTMLSGMSNEGCYSNPMALDLNFVARTLKWPGDSTEEQASAARSFIEDLPQGIRIDDTYPESMMLLASSKRAVLQPSEVVDVELIASIKPRAFAVA